MRTLLYLLMLLVVLPYVLLATGFLLLGQAIGDGSLLSFFDTLFSQFLWIVPWGMIGFALCVLFLAALGVTPRSRWLAGLLLSMIACASLLVIILLSSSPLDSGQVLFLVPCLLATIVGAWLTLTEWPFM